MNTRRVRTALTTLAAAMALAPAFTFAQTENSDWQMPPWYVSANGGYIKFEGDEATVGGFVGTLKLGYDISPHWSFEGSLYVMPGLGSNEVYNYATGERVRREGLRAASTTGYGLGLDALFHLRNTKNIRIDPYVLGGVGGVYYDEEREFRSNPEALLRFGGGVKYHFNNEWAIRADVVEVMTLEAGGHELNFMPSAGIDWKWGAHVPQKFHAAGGPLDSDGDGLIDVDEVPWKTDPRNPDTDGDGLLDGEEVHTHHTDPLNPDTDYDLLKDGAEVHTYKTNPLDRDTDKGGVSDGHEVLEDHTNPQVGHGDDDLMLFTLHIEFDTDKSVIRAEYFKDLDIIGKVLARNPDAVAVVEGHADKRKTSVKEHNDILSDNRAKAVAKYLEENFKVAAKRFTPKGYGFNRPVAPNDPISGNQANRRVEIYIRGANKQAEGYKPAPSTPVVVPVPEGWKTPAPMTP